MKTNVSGAKKHRCLLSFLSAASAFVLFVSSFAAASSAFDPAAKAQNCRQGLALSISNAFIKNNSQTDGNNNVSEPAVSIEEYNGPEVIINNAVQNIEACERSGDILINLAEFLSVCRPSCTVSSGAMFEAEDEGLSLSVCFEANCIIANGRYLWCNGGISCEAGEIVMPASVAARIVCARNETQGKKAVFNISESAEYIEDGDSFYNEEDVYWLSRIICAESRGEVLEGKIAVGNVVLNRVLTNGYPNTIYDVIFDSSSGVQFSPAANGTIYNEPSHESVVAAKLCLEGVSVSNEILYFLNPDTAENFWITANRTYITTIGNHAFYS